MVYISYFPFYTLVRRQHQNFNIHNHKQHFPSESRGFEEVAFQLLLSDQWSHYRRRQGGWTEKGVGRHSSVALLTKFFTDLCEKIKFDDAPCLWQRVWSCNSCSGKIDLGESLAWVRNARSVSNISRKIISKKKKWETHKIIQSWRTGTHMPIIWTVKFQMSLVDT